MKLEGGAAAPGRPRAGECPRGAPVPGREPWGRAVGRRAGALGSGEASGLGGGGAETGWSVLSCPSLCLSANPSLAPFVFSLS